MTTFNKQHKLYTVGTRPVNMRKSSFWNAYEGNKHNLTNEYHVRKHKIVIRPFVYSYIYIYICIRLNAMENDVLFRNFEGKWNVGLAKYFFRRHDQHQCSDLIISRQLHHCTQNALLKVLLYTLYSHLTAYLIVCHLIFRRHFLTLGFYTRIIILFCLM